LLGPHCGWGRGDFGPRIAGRTAVVRWQNGGLMGLMFDSELDSRVVSALMERSRALEAVMQTRE
jgi:hypothetical protein